MNYTAPSTEFRREFLSLVGQAQTILLTAHVSPDDDSIASVLSLLYILKIKYPKKTLRIVYTGQPTKKYQSFANSDQVEFVEDLANHLGKADLLIFLDGSQYHRFSKQPEKLQRFAGDTICIDHHSSPIDQFSLSLVAPTISSTAEIVYLSLCQDESIDKPLAELFLLGILGDTNNFSYLKPHQTDTLITAQKLLSISQVEIQTFKARYSTISTKVFDLVSAFAENTQFHKLPGWPPFQTSHITRNYLEGRQYTENEVADACHTYMSYFLRSITDYQWGFVTYPLSGSDCKISLRSLPDSVNVREIVERMEIGGGVNLSAGGTFKAESDQEQQPAECLSQAIDWLKTARPR